MKTWATPWDLRTVMPLKIRAFPDWNAGADPTYLSYGYPQYFQTAVDLAGVPAGSYQWVMKVDNPSPTGKTLRFANTTQNTNGWLGLGAVTVNAATVGSAPAAPTALTFAATASTVGLSWTAPSGRSRATRCSATARRSRPPRPPRTPTRSCRCTPRTATPSRRSPRPAHFSEINEDYAPVNINIWKAANPAAPGLGEKCPGARSACRSILVRMENDQRYTEAQRYPAVVTDAYGRCETTLVDDGGKYEMMLRGRRFVGSPESLTLVESPADAEKLPEPPELLSGDLCSCTIEWTVTVPVVSAEGGLVDRDLRIRLALGRPGPTGGLERCDVALTMTLPTVTVATRPRESMEDALLELHRGFPVGTRVVACFSCAFSDVHWAGSGFMGLFLCYRDSKEAYRGVRHKVELVSLTDADTPTVQETFLCEEYEYRGKNAGMRGWPFPL